MHDQFYYRQPLLNGHGKVVATRLCFDPLALGHDLATVMPGLAITLDHLGDVWPDGEKTVFIALQGITVEAGLLTWVGRDNAAIEVGSTAFAGDTGQALVAALQGRRTALCLHYDDQVGTAFDSGVYFRFLGFDVDAFSPAQIGHHVTRTASLGIPVAFGVTTAAEFKTCIDAGVSAAAGWFFMQPTQTPAKSINPSHAHIMQVLNLVRHNANVAEVESALKQDVALSYKLLRYINSAGFGLSCEIQSFRHAVTILGYDKLNRWLSLLLATASKDPLAPALLHTALVRARLMELLGHGLVDPSEYDNLFITGAFSLLDVMLGVGMEKVLEAMHLPETISDALLGHGGIYAPFLELARAVERPEVREIARQAGQLGLGAMQVNRAQLEAIAFADRMEF